MHHQAYFVGGCVRDLLLGATPKDFDVATDAHPGEVRAIFRNCRLIGRRFRLAHVYFRGGKVIEVATFRKNPVEAAEDVGEDVDLLIARDNVFGTAEEDAVRRDFTVNGLFYDVASGEVIDYCGGRADLEDHRIATIGDPEIRMREDPVRALRAVRFASRLGFTIAPDTFEAMRRHAGELARCAPARVLEEIFKILRCAASARAFELLRACGALPIVLPALGAALEGWDESRRRSFFAHLQALDRLVRSGEEVSDAVLLGAVVMHLGTAGRRPADDLESEGGDETRVDEQGEPILPPPSGAAEALLASLVQTSRLPRRVAERTRLALNAQRAFAAPARRKRRRGRGGAGQAYHEDAVQLLRISVQATGQGREALDKLVEAGGAPAERPSSAVPSRSGGPARSAPAGTSAPRSRSGPRQRPATPRARPTGHRRTRGRPGAATAPGAPPRSPRSSSAPQRTRWTTTRRSTGRMTPRTAPLRRPPTAPPPRMPPPPSPAAAAGAGVAAAAAAAGREPGSAPSAPSAPVAT